MAYHYTRGENQRRNAVLESNLNGIDYLEVMDLGLSERKRQKILKVHFLKDLNDDLNGAGPETRQGNVR